MSSFFIVMLGERIFKQRPHEQMGRTRREMCQDDQSYQGSREKVRTQTMTKNTNPKLKICRWWEPLKSGNNRKRMNIIANNCVPKLKVITYRGPKARESRC